MKALGTEVRLEGGRQGSLGANGRVGGRKIGRWRTRDEELSLSRRALIRTKMTGWVEDSAGWRVEGRRLEGKEQRGGSEMESKGGRAV